MSRIRQMFSFDLLRHHLMWLKHLYIKVRTERYVQYLYKQLFNKDLDLNRPKNYNEWIQWSKFKSDTSRWAELSDKYLVRKYVTELGLGDLLVKLYGVYDNVSCINWEILPDSFILKTNNGSGCNMIVSNKSNLDIKTSTKKLDKWLNTPYGYRFAELHYLDIKPKIIVEELLDCAKQPIKTNSLIDYKFFCANGEPLCILVIWGRKEETFECAVYDMEWKCLKNKIRYNTHYLEPDKSLPRPFSLDQMIVAVRKLSSPFPLVRVDLYEIDNKPYFGEITFTSGGGFMDYFTEDFLLELGNKVRR